VLKPIKLLEGIGNGGNGYINTEHSDIVKKWSIFHSSTIYWSPWELLPVEHLQIYILYPRWCTLLYLPLLILACLTGVSGLVV